MRNRYRLWLILTAFIVLVGGGAWWLIAANRQYDFPEAAGDFKPSADLPADLKRMWETQPLRNPDATHGPNPKASTEEAVKAASRVFATVELGGKTRDEVIALFGDPRTASDSEYNFPWYPAPKGSLVYRFDIGCGGWQFNVLFGPDGRTSAVKRYGIE